MAAALLFFAPRRRHVAATMLFHAAFDIDISLFAPLLILFFAAMSLLYARARTLPPYIR